jgi:Flp pilus assembly protein TadB
MKRTRNQAGDRRRRKMFTVLWTAVLALATIVMIYREMTALLYILATVGVTALLVVVAQSDLAHDERVSPESPPMDDSAAIGSGMKSTFSSNKS